MTYIETHAAMIALADAKIRNQISNSGNIEIITANTLYIVPTYPVPCDSPLSEFINLVVVLDI